MRIGGGDLPVVRFDPQDPKVIYSASVVCWRSTDGGKTWDGWRGALYRLAVAPSHRRRGIATALVDEAEQYLHVHGVRRMHLIVSTAGGPAAVDFWKSARYEPTDQLRMVKDLA